MSVTNHERPGVYSRYDASTVVKGRGGGGCVGLAALCGTGTAGTLYTFNRYEEAVTAFGGEETLTELVRLLFLNGAAQVKAVPVAEEAGYKAAFSVLEAAEDIAVVVCDSGELTVQQALRDSVKAASEARRERIAVVGGKAGENATALVQRAEGLNSERVVLTAPVGEGGGAVVAAAVAGAIAGESDPAIPLGGAELKGVDGLEARYGDTEIDTLVRGGVTPVEQAAGVVSVVRGVTTRTKTGEAADATWRELTTIRIVDDVIPTVRDALRARFRRAKNTEQSRGAIRSQVVLELENKLAREIITGYGEVSVEADADNPTVCLVDFSFTVAHGLNQIWLNAHMAVVQSYTAKSSRTSQTVEAFGEDEPVATIPGQRTHVIELTRLYATDEAIRDGLNFHALEDFSLVICKPDRKIIYSGCQWSSIGETGALGAMVVEKITIVAARRIETAV